MPATKILCVHGISNVEKIGAGGPDENWFQPWGDEITAAFKRCQNPDPPQFWGVPYDQFFAEAHLDPSEYMEAFGELASSVAWHAIAGPSEPRAFGLPNLGILAGRWFAGMVVMWIVDAGLRQKCRDAISEQIQKFNPDIICAHSLGSLLCYDLFTYDDPGREMIAGRTFITFGSQIGNLFVTAKAWGGLVRMIEAKNWYHLFNHDDPVFTAEIQEPGVPNFLQIITDSPAGHSPTVQGANPGYLDHPNTFENVWQPLARPELSKSVARAIGPPATTKPLPPSHRALLVGINAYPDPANRLNGCVNDTYLMSAVLQENGFAPENIRLLTDERATRGAILDRLHWLLDDIEDESYRVFYYSGHGVQIPGYGGVNQQVDHLEDGLVPVDFDWSNLNAITDRDLLAVYAQLPYTTRFIAAFDCCYSGGLVVRSMHGRARTLSIPPDIRHRIQQWNPGTRSWGPRPLPSSTPGLAAAARERYAGKDGATYKLGRAVPLRKLDDKQYDQVRKLRDHQGPYLPVVLEACRADQLSYEYTNGSSTNGAFTYALVQEYRATAKRRPATTFVELMRRTNTQIKKLGFAEEPQLVGPDEVVKGPIPRAIPNPNPPAAAAG